MKINVTVDLEDFYNEEDSSFNEQIVSYINYQVKNEIWGEFRKIALDDFKLKLNAELLQEKDQEVQRIITKVFSDRKIKVREISKGNPEPEMVTMFEYIQDRIEKEYFSPDKTAEYVLRDKIREFQVLMEKTLAASAQKITDELKDRYDLLFASQIVSNLSKNGLLKEDMSKLLIDK